MDVLTEVFVKNSHSHGHFLCVSVFAPDTQQLCAQMYLCRLYGLEVEFIGGRFQNYRRAPQAHGVTIYRAFGVVGECPHNSLATGMFGSCVEWIATEVSSPWSFTVKATMEFADSEPEMRFGFSFTDVDDAVLFKLKFG